MKILSLLLYVLVLTPSSFAGASQSESDIKVFGKADAKKSVLLVPGLNFEPSAFSTIIDEFVKSDHQVYLLHLKYTHNPDRDWEGDDLTKLWPKQVADAIKRVSVEAKKNNRQYKIVAYSLGGLVTELVLQKSDIVSDRLSKIVYLAPAFEIDSFLEFSLNSVYFLPNWLKIFSLNLEEYRTRSYTYVGEYLALVELVEELHARELKTLSVPTSLVMSPGDELLDYDLVMGWLYSMRFELTVVPVKIDKKATVGKKHLIVDDKSLVSEDYSKLLKAIL